MSVWELEPGASPRKRLWRFAVLSSAALALAGCATTSTSQYGGNGKEHFSSSRYGPASPRVVAAGQPVPHGGGQYLVGRPYSVAGRMYYPSENTAYSAVGMASWYGSAFHGRRTANGEVYDMASLSAAHPTMPLPSYARVTNLTNGYSVIVRVNDRGPFHGGRVMDVSSRVADVLDFKGAGTAKIRVDYMARAPMEGSDDARLLASLRTDGRLATLDGIPADSGTMVAEQAPSAPEPAPAPQPVRVALVAPAAPRPAEPEPAPAPSHAGPVNAPLPPSRPFDLGTIPNAAIPVAALNPMLPPRRPIVQASAERALYFAAADKPSQPLRRRDPFAQLRPAEVVFPPPRP
jgi:rare lipoprotein A